MFLARHSGQLGRPPRRRCVTRQAAFLAAYRKTAIIAAAAKAAGIKPAQHCGREGLSRYQRLQRHQGGSPLVRADLD
jgi:hypothetical protein